MSTSIDNNDNNDNVMSTLVLMLKIGLVLEYLSTQSIKDLLSSSSSLLAINGISTDVMDRIINESFKQNQSLSLCSLSILSPLSVLPTLSLRLNDITIIRKPDVPITLTDLKTAFISIAKCRCCFQSDDEAIIVVTTSDYNNVENNRQDIDNWELENVDIEELGERHEPEYKTMLTVQRNWPTVSSNHQMILMHNAVPWIRRSVAVMQDPSSTLLRMNIDNPYMTPNITICPSNCNKCGLRRCDKCHPAKICLDCLQQYCQACCNVNQCYYCSKTQCSFCVNDDWFSCEKCDKQACENCENEFFTYCDTCQLLCCLDCNDETFNCESCSRSCCKLCTVDPTVVNSIIKCPNCHDIICLHCSTYVFCALCKQLQCRKCDAVFQSITTNDKCNLIIISDSSDQWNCCDKCNEVICNDCEFIYDCDCCNDFNICIKCNETFQCNTCNNHNCKLCAEGYFSGYGNVIKSLVIWKCPYCLELKCLDCKSALKCDSCYDQKCTDCEELKNCSSCDKLICSTCDPSLVSSSSSSSETPYMCPSCNWYI